MDIRLIDKGDGLFRPDRLADRNIIKRYGFLQNKSWLNEEEYERLLRNASADGYTLVTQTPLFKGDK